MPLRTISVNVRSHFVSTQNPSNVNAIRGRKKYKLSISKQIHPNKSMINKINIFKWPADLPIALFDRSHACECVILCKLQILYCSSVCTHYRLHICLLLLYLVCEKKQKIEFICVLDEAKTTTAKNHTHIEPKSVQKYFLNLFRLVPTAPAATVDMYDVLVRILLFYCYCIYISVRAKYLLFFCSLICRLLLIKPIQPYMSYPYMQLQWS